MKHNLLVSTSQTIALDEGDLAAPSTEVHFEERLSDKELDGLLPSVDCMLTAWWPGRLSGERLRLLGGLKMVQCLFAGVDALPLGLIPEGATLCSNAGAFSEEVGEFAIGLLMAAAKWVVRYSLSMADRRDAAIYPGTHLLRGAVLGVLGYGGIGRVAARAGRGIGMEVLSYSRRAGGEVGFAGRDGLMEVLRRSDAAVLALPLTNLTRNIIGREELAVMKEDAILVNVARGDLVDRRALAEHLRSRPSFRYATDVGWSVDGREEFDGDLLHMTNYLATPHVSGYTSHPTRRPVRMAMENLRRYLRGERPLNVVERSEYG
ncbi:MAG: hydroxyacid dehydrogenase [Nitrososphaerota archaeon]|nr:hydroxyacid dehydrogenase [Nitrososphaerota archaeon]